MYFGCTLLLVQKPLLLDQNVLNSAIDPTTYKIDVRITLIPEDICALILTCQHPTHLCGISFTCRSNGSLASPAYKPKDSKVQFTMSLVSGAPKFEILVSRVSVSVSV